MPWLRSPSHEKPSNQYSNNFTVYSITLFGDDMLSLYFHKYNLTSRPIRSVNVCNKHFLQERIMGVFKFKNGTTYYADYRDVTGKRRRISLQTQNKLVANLKYEEIIRRRDAVKEKIQVHISWKTFKDKLLSSISVEKADNTVLRTKLAIRYESQCALCIPLLV